MNIFYKRPLALILCIGLGGFLLFTLDNPILRVALIISAVLLCILSLILRKDKYRQTLMRIISGVILLSSLFSFLYFDLYFKAYEVYDDRVDVVGTVEEVSSSSSYTMRLTVKAESVNGKASTYRFYAYPTKTEAKGVVEGARIKFTAELDGFSDESYTYNLSNGINAYASDVEDLEILEYTSGGISERIKRIREYATRYIITLSDKDTGAILSALLLGERDYLPDQLRLDFKRIGISHILALSGMHLAILSLGIGKLLSFIGVKKKPRVLITAIFVFLYMALTGFSVSVVRAGVMVIIASSLFLLARSSDSLTSLAVAVTVICIATPYAIMDISLWLSALATFGIIAYGEFVSTLERPKTMPKRIINYVLVGILASIFAISATMAVSTFTFGGFSVLAPITTLIFSILAEIIMYLGCAMLVIGWLLPIGFILSPLCKFMSFLAGVFSDIDFAYVSSSFSFVKVLVFIYTFAFALLLVLNIGKRKLAINILVVCYAIVTIIPTVATVKQSHTETIAYYSDYKCDEMLIRSKNEVCLINSSQYSKSLVYTSLDLLEDANVTHLDKYYLTHYSWSLDEDIETLLYNISVDEIYIPEPRNEDEETILKILYKSVESSRSKIQTFRIYETVYVGNYSINILYSEPYGNTSMNAFVVADEDEIYTYISSGLLSGKTESLFRNYIALSNTVILGDHGKKYKETVYISEYFERLNNIIMHSDNVFLKQSNMQKYLDNDCNIILHPKNIVYLKNE